MSNWTIQGGFSETKVIASDDLMDWSKKQHEKNMMERDPIIRANNFLQLTINTSILPDNPIKDADMKEVDSFPFNQIQNNSENSTHKLLMEIEQKILSQTELKPGANFDSESQKQELGKLLGTTNDQTQKLLKFINGEISTF